MKKIISLLLLGFMMPLGASAQADIFASTLLGNSLPSMSTDLSEASRMGENASVAPVTGKFTLKGVAGEGQGNKYDLWYMGKDKIEKWGLEKISSNLLLNKETYLQTGFYFVEYEESFTHIEIKEGQTLEVNLEKIDITPKDHKYKVYLDLLSEKQIALMRKIAWSNPGYDLDELQEFCDDYRYKGAGKFCKLLLSKDFDTYAEGILKFNDKSEAFIIKMDCETRCSMGWQNIGRYYVNHATSSNEKETFVSVLPGDYKVEFTR